MWEGGRATLVLSSRLVFQLDLVLVGAEGFSRKKNLVGLLGVHGLDGMVFVVGLRVS